MKKKPTIRDFHPHGHLIMASEGGSCCLLCGIDEWVTTPAGLVVGIPDPLAMKFLVDQIHPHPLQAAFYQHLQTPQHSIYESSVKGQVIRVIPVILGGVRLKPSIWPISQHFVGRRQLQIQSASAPQQNGTAAISPGHRRSVAAMLQRVGVRRIALGNRVGNTWSLCQPSKMNEPIFLPFWDEAKQDG